MLISIVEFMYPQNDHKGENKWPEVKLGSIFLYLINSKLLKFRLNHVMKSYKNGRIQNIDKCEEHDYREKKSCITIKSKAEGSKIDPRKVSKI